MNSVKPFLDRSPDVLHFTEEDLGRRNFTPDALLAVAVATPIKESSIMMVFSRGCSTLVGLFSHAVFFSMPWARVLALTTAGSGGPGYARPSGHPRIITGLAGSSKWASAGVAELGDFVSF